MKVLKVHMRWLHADAVCGIRFWDVEDENLVDDIAKVTCKTCLKYTASQ